MKIVQCIPNFSEGTSKEIIADIVAPLKDQNGFKMIGCEPDKSYNRTVVTLLGSPDAMIAPLLQFIKNAVELIDLNTHRGEPPRMGAVDVIPFVPIKGVTMKECINYAQMLGKETAARYNFPVFLYEEAAMMPERVNLADIRKGEFEGMKEKIKLPLWKPDFGSAAIHPTAGVVAIGARSPLIAYNINLGTSNINIAKEIAKAIRHSSGGFRYIKAGAAKTDNPNVIQVTMNITDYQKTPIYRVFEAVKTEAKRYGVNVLGSEVIGMMPTAAALESLAYYLGIDKFGSDKVIESYLLDK